MVRLEECKQETEDKPIESLPLPQQVYILLNQHTGKICTPIVKRGDSVLAGQMIANAEARIYAPIHASISGKVLAIRECPHPVLGRCEAIVIENDGIDKSQAISSRPQDEIDRLTPEDLRKIVFEAGIVGMGGAGFPAHIKLNPPNPVDTLIVNGAECEPYLTGDSRLMVEKTKEILKGIELVVKCLGVKKVYIAIENNKPQAIKAFNHELRTMNYELRILKSYYPQGGEKQLTKNILSKEVPQGKLPFDIGVVVHNVGTIFAIYEAVYLNKPLYERVVTVTGSCLSNPKNLSVRIGTPIKNLIEECGPLTKEPAKLVMGGPMMGSAQYSKDSPVIKTTTGLILFSEEEIEDREEEFCIHCGECVINCPIGIYPNMASLATEFEKWDLANSYGALDCIECGLCSYVCPAKRNLVQAIKKAKIMIKR